MPVHPLQKYIKNNLEFVSKLERQLTHEQAEKILKDYPDKKLVAQTLGEMENYKPLTRRYRSVYLTLRNWLDKNIDLRENPPANAPKRHAGWTCSHTEALAWLHKRGIAYSELDNKFETVKENGTVKFRYIG